MKVRLHDGEVYEPPKMKGGIVERPVFTCLHAFPECPCRFLVRIAARVRRSEHGLYADLLALIAEQLRHPLRAFDQRKGLLGLADRVVRAGEIAQSNQLVSGTETFLETIEECDRISGSALLDEASRL